MADSSRSANAGSDGLKTATQLDPISQPQTQLQGQSIGQMRSTIQQQVATNTQPLPSPYPETTPTAEPMPTVEPGPTIEPKPTGVQLEDTTVSTTPALQAIPDVQPVGSVPPASPVAVSTPVLPMPAMQPMPAIQPLGTMSQPAAAQSPMPLPRSRRRGTGCLRVIPRLGCRTLGCFGCFLPLVLVFLAALFLLIRPAELWEPFKELLNTEVSTQSASQIPQTPNDVANARLIFDLLEQAKVSKSFKLEQAQLAEIFASRIELARGMFVELKDDQLVLYRNLESKGEPLWLIAYFTLQDGSFTLSKLMISSVELPEFVRNIARDGLQSGFDFVNLQDPSDLFGKLIQVGQQPAEVVAIKLIDRAVIIELK